MRPAIAVAVALLAGCLQSSGNHDDFWDPVPIVVMDATAMGVQIRVDEGVHALRVQYPEPTRFAGARIEAATQAWGLVAMTGDRSTAADCTSAGATLTLIGTGGATGMQRDTGNVSTEIRVLVASVGGVDVVLYTNATDAEAVFAGQPGAPAALARVDLATDFHAGSTWQSQSPYRVEHNGSLAQAGLVAGMAAVAQPYDGPGGGVPVLDPPPESTRIEYGMKSTLNQGPCRAEASDGGTKTSSQGGEVQARGVAGPRLLDEGPYLWQAEYESDGDQQPSISYAVWELEWPPT